jgi:hypothetical protein
MNFSFYGIPVTMHNSPGLLMAFLWIILAILTLCFFFDLPVKIISNKKFHFIFFCVSQNDHKSRTNSVKNYSIRQACKWVYMLCKKPVILVSRILSVSTIGYKT